MEKHKDAALTNMVKQHLNSMKKEKAEAETASTATLLVVAAMGIGKWAALSLLFWWSWNIGVTKAGAAGLALSYIDAVALLAGARAVTMALIDPLITKIKEKK